MSKMKVYKVNYRGLWMGGVAIVLAHDEQEAKRLVSESPSTIKFEDVRVSDLDINIDSSGVVFNDNGDY